VNDRRAILQQTVKLDGPLEQPGHIAAITTTSPRAISSTLAHRIDFPRHIPHVFP
jgi:hypothetical protein